MIDYLFRWTSEAAAIADVQTWPKQPGAMVTPIGGGQATWVWDTSYCHLPQVERKTGVVTTPPTLPTDPPLGSEIRSNLGGFWLWMSLERYYRFLLNHPNLRLCRNRETGRIVKKPASLTAATAREYRVSPVILGSDYRESEAVVEEVDPDVVDPVSPPPPLQASKRKRRNAPVH